MSNGKLSERVYSSGPDIGAWLSSLHPVRLSMPLDHGSQYYGNSLKFKYYGIL